PAELKPFHVEEWVDSYRLSTTSRRNYFRTIKRCLNWAERQGYIDKNPIEFLEVPSADRKDTYVSPEQFEELLTYVVDPFLRDLLVVTYTTGCRPQESLRVQCRHVELKNKRWVFPQKEAKCKKGPRIVYLTDDALSITKKLLDDSKPNQFLFRNNRGHSWTTEAVNCAFDRIQTRMGKRVLEGKGFVLSPKEITRFLPSLKPTRLIKGKPHTKTKAELRCEAKVKLMRKKAREVAPRYSLYALRHSWATNALQAGVDALTVAILMGHRDPSMLAKVYQHLQHNPEHMLEQARKAASGTIIESRKC
ncbi:MAG: tyrosine-type recombinase/integrase, partial [Planctomycetales bacterium]|nr:tyrosine-type recombinase/integrase [Planctomycetales bacterium]